MAAFFVFHLWNSKTGLLQVWRASVIFLTIADYGRRIPLKLGAGSWKLEDGRWKMEDGRWKNVQQYEDHQQWLFLFFKSQFQFV
ncbi:hypothetical protein NK356_23205 [Chryseobacterium sp. S0630]|uniref:hypothetical protein n=1 Tax=Chryseobacterium sp. S0630 TaxID=2957803 RepID=UPI00209FD234|nr:hypothetical protein [Chryseobacterium sp. S0630]MCP1302086.1 hypothetical protein [Chryseobacterium sp. S0630]